MKHHERTLSGQIARACFVRYVRRLPWMQTICLDASSSESLSSRSYLSATVLLPSASKPDDSSPEVHLMSAQSSC